MTVIRRMDELSGALAKITISFWGYRWDINGNA
jgi:hypothetical protein